MEEAIYAPKMPNAARLASGLGVAWNIFGVVQFSGQALSTPAMLMNNGMTAEQAALYAALPAWMTIVFAIGVFGGLAGSFLLMIGRQGATMILAASLLGYIALYVGDITEGVFATFGTSQIAILSAVVAIAVGLLALSIYAQRKNWLR